ncbi:hypothetical protein [Bacillus sp. ISL-37]|jgi:hypothetical protein|uniref:hypothetical protein n=1 Tax=Bacillus sp. ISL-37 TaxID=2819123 RepID=UPI001BE8948C|nr:hypothetical protein [Bacillus sp. ISL-37]MBT2684708.1 hypothetical protein [Bacillus sp. ISL-37]
MGHVLFAFVLAAIGGIWYGCSMLQLRISNPSTSHAGWKTFGNIVLLVLGPIAVVAFSLFLITQFDLILDRSEEGFGWVYVIYFMLQIIVIPAKALYLPILHVLARKRKQKLMNANLEKSI